MGKFFVTLALLSASNSFAQQSSIKCSLTPPGMTSEQVSQTNLVSGDSKIISFSGDINFANRNWILTRSEIVMTGEILITAMPISLSSGTANSSVTDFQSAVSLVLSKSNTGAGASFYDRFKQAFSLICYRQ